MFFGTVTVIPVLLFFIFAIQAPSAWLITCIAILGVILLAAIVTSILAMGFAISAYKNEQLIAKYEKSNYAFDCEICIWLSVCSVYDKISTIGKHNKTKEKPNLNEDTNQNQENINGKDDKNLSMGNIVKFENQNLSLENNKNTSKDKNYSINPWSIDQQNKKDKVKNNHVITNLAIKSEILFSIPE